MRYFGERRYQAGIFVLILHLDAVHMDPHGTVSLSRENEWSSVERWKWWAEDWGEADWTLSSEPTETLARKDQESPGRIILISK